MSNSIRVCKGQRGGGCGSTFSGVQLGSLTLSEVLVKRGHLYLPRHTGASALGEAGAKVPDPLPRAGRAGGWMDRRRRGKAARLRLTDGGGFLSSL